MAGWKITKTSWGFRPSSGWKHTGRGWKFKKTEATPDYDEGDITTYSDNHVWRVYPTDETNRTFHDPCGYWTHLVIYYTTLMYPVVCVEKLDGKPDLDAGIFRQVFHFYSYTEEMEGVPDLASGIFRSVIILYDWAEEMEGVPALTSGVFKDVFHYYTVPTEEVEGVPAITAGKHWEVVRYLNWPEEEVESTGIDLDSGEFYAS